MLTSSYPSGFFVRNLGPIGDLNVETEALLLENQIVNNPFSQQALAELPSQDWTPSTKGRKDLRKSHMVCLYITLMYRFVVLILLVVKISMMHYQLKSWTMVTFK